MEHITLKEQLKGKSRGVKFACYTGMLKLIPKEGRQGDCYTYGCRLRLLHPFSWPYLLFILLMHGFNRETFEQLGEESVWW
ncbi:TPA: hypothetical protein ACGW7B_005784 [Bacillus nitratireducens]|uniref:hypothetical protein n=1 Tax=unclassified Bacillus cereus group TaxID=2750818 RepID=UPI001F5747B0|nr:hypothetical protein [Bacillus cereus group sp. BfR-BA-01324]